MVRELTKIGNETANMYVKTTAVYANVNGDIESYTSKTAKIKKVILLNDTLIFGDVLLGNITFLYKYYCSFFTFFRI